jgi:hypothetical protein
MSISPSSHSYRIDVVAALGRASRTVVENFEIVFRFAWLPIVLGIVALEVLDWPVSVTLIVPVVHPYLMVAALIGLELLAPIALLFVVTLFLARWYRFILLGEGRPDMFPPLHGLFTQAALKVGVILYAVFQLIFWSFFLFGRYLLLHDDVTQGMLLVGLPILFGLEISLVFPAAAVGKPLSLRAARELLAGNHWRLFAAVGLAAVPFGVLHSVVGAAPHVSAVVSDFVITPILFAVWFVFFAVVAALLCDVYRHLVGTDQAVATGAR